MLAYCHIKKKTHTHRKCWLLFRSWLMSCKVMYSAQYMVIVQTKLAEIHYWDSEAQMPQLLLFSVRTRCLCSPQQPSTYNPNSLFKTPAEPVWAELPPPPPPSGFSSWGSCGFSAAQFALMVLWSFFGNLPVSIWVKQACDGVSGFHRSTTKAVLCLCAPILHFII